MHRLVACNRVFGLPLFEGGAYGGSSFFNMSQRFFLFHGIEFKTDSKRVFLFIPVCTEQYELP